MRQSVTALLAVVAAGSMILGLGAGCGSSPKPAPGGKSAGTQLLELKEARDSGVITDKEYERMRKRIVRDND